jgi:hypothetical protein
MTVPRKAWTLPISDRAWLSSVRIELLKMHMAFSHETLAGSALFLSYQQHLGIFK